MWRTTQLGGGVDVVGACVWVECWRVWKWEEGWGLATAARSDGGSADGRVPTCSSVADERGGGCVEEGSAANVEPSNGGGRDDDDDGRTRRHRRAAHMREMRPPVVVVWWYSVV